MEARPVGEEAVEGRPSERRLSVETRRRGGRQGEAVGGDLSKRRPYIEGRKVVGGDPSL